MSKVCNRCRSLLSKDCFHLASRHPDGLQYTCKQCKKEDASERRRREPEKFNRPRTREARRREHLKAKYSMVPGDYDRLVSSQAGKCAICGKETAYLCIDHDHKTGRVRALLCRPCNLILGFSKENSNILRHAIAYLDKQKHQNQKSNG